MEQLIQRSRQLLIVLHQPESVMQYLVTQGVSREDSFLATHAALLLDGKKITDGYSNNF